MLSFHCYTLLTRIMCTQMDGNEVDRALMRSRAVCDRLGVVADILRNKLDSVRFSVLRSVWTRSDEWPFIFVIPALSGLAASVLSLCAKKCTTCSIVDGIFTSYFSLTTNLIDGLPILLLGDGRSAKSADMVFFFGKSRPADQALFVQLKEESRGSFRADELIPLSGISAWGKTSFLFSRRRNSPAKTLMCIWM